MKKVFKNKLQGMSWWMKTSLVLLLTLATTTFMSDGLYTPQGAEASVATLNAWSATPQIVSNAISGTVTGSVTVLAGANRVMLVVVGADYTTAPATQPMTVTYGGQPVYQLSKNINAAQTIWLGFVNEAGLAAASGSILSVTNGNTTNLSAMYASAAVFSGVDQANPISNVNTASSNVAVNNINLPSTKVKGAAGNTALSFYITCRNLQFSSADTAYTQNVDYAGTNAYMSFNTITAAPAALVTTTPVANTAIASSGSAVVVGLVPLGVTGFGSITSCGGCHFYPGTAKLVQDGTARNAPVGQFMGDHAIHSGNSATQYNFVCTTCHYDQISKGNAHQDGYINLSGSRLSGSAYSLTDVPNHRKAIVNAPAFGSCSGIYCHSAGTGGTSQAGESRGIGTGAAMTWGTTVSNCTTSCHSGGTASGPTYVSGSPKANSHAAHRVTNGYTCDICHYTTTTNGTTMTNFANHVNRIYDVSPSPTKSFTYTYASTGGTCKSSNCHGGAGINLTWATTANPRGTTKCTKCHGIQSATIGTNYSSASVAPGSATGNDLAGNFNVSTRGGSHQGHLTAATSISDKIHCGECHKVVTAVNTATHMRYTTASPVFTGVLGTANSHVPSVTRTGGIISCANTYCHTGTRVGATAFSTTPAWNNSPALLGNTTIADTCTRKCHAMPPGNVTNGGISGDTHWGLADVTTPANLTSCSSQTGGTGCHPTLAGAPTSMATIWFSAINKLLHINGKVDGGGCIGCHGTTKLRTVGRLGGKGIYLSAVTTEFGLAYGHKASGKSPLRGAVTDADCIVCHLEGNFTTQKPDNYDASTNPTGKHKDGNIDLRDPKGAGETPITNLTGGAFTFQRFSTSYAAGSRTTTGHMNNADIAQVIALKFCVVCHSSGGATNPTARSYNGGTPTANMPFGGFNLGANYTVLKGASVAGGAINVFSQFSSGNSSAHPVRAPRTKDFPTPARLNAPYNNFTRVGTSATKTLGVVINCFDCHNRITGGLLTLRTISAHGSGGTAQVRGTFYVATPSLCIACHKGYNVAPGSSSAHGAGSALVSGSLDGGESLTSACTNCHASQNALPARPVPAADYHGFNKLLSGANWPTINSRPFGFIRNTGNYVYHRPFRSTELTTGAAGCSGGATQCANQNGAGPAPYTPGGSY